MKHLVLFVHTLSRFEVTRFRLTADSWKVDEIWGFPRQIFRGGVKHFSQVGFGPKLGAVPLLGEGSWVPI